MRFDDGAADAKSHAGAVGLGSKEGIEDLVRLLRGSPTPVSPTETSRCSFFRNFCDLITNSRVSSTSFIASMLFMMRFIMTCSNCTRSPLTCGRSAASSVRTDMEYRVVSPRRRTIISPMTSLHQPSRAAEYLLEEQADPADDFPRTPSVNHDSRGRRACLFHIRGLAASQRKEVLALVTAAAIGWIHFVAKEAVSSPMVVTRLTCARSACAWRSASSACLRLVRSTMTPRKRVTRSPSTKHSYQVAQPHHTSVGSDHAVFKFMSRFLGCCTLAELQSPISVIGMHVVLPECRFGQPAFHRVAEDALGLAC